MQQRPFIPPARQVKKTPFSHGIRAIGLGLAYAGLDYFSTSFHDGMQAFLKPKIPQRTEQAPQAPHTQPVQQQIQPIPATKQPVGTEKKEKEFSRDEMLKFIEKKQSEHKDVIIEEVKEFYPGKSHEDTIIKDRLFENFIYGALLAKLGKEIRGSFLTNYLQSWKLGTKLLMTFPVPIVSYYAFCNFWEGKNAGELAYRLQHDFFLLFCVRIITAIMERKAMIRFNRLTQSIEAAAQDPKKRMDPMQQQKIIQSAMKSVTFSRNLISGTWIFVLTYFYKYPFYDVEPSI